MAEKISTVQSFLPRPVFPDPPRWILETNSLHIPPSDESSASESLPYLPPLPAKPVPFSNFPNRTAISRKIAKRKSRASKRTPTTYINADPANFRRMVQEVTGIRIGDGGMPVEPAVWREPVWAGIGGPAGLSSLGLGASSLIVDRAGPTGSGCGSFEPAQDSSFFDFESFPGSSSFPTLDYWGTM